MHWQAYQYIATIKQLLPSFFIDRSVLEVGSHSVNGSIRELFSTDHYTGLDLSAGPRVDVIISGHEFEAEHKFDICISCECFEHNPYYLETLENMINHTNEDGLIILSCATEGRPEHGTTRTDPSLSPGTSAINWDYYKNLCDEDFDALELNSKLAYYAFYKNTESCDLYFVGTKSEHLAEQLRKSSDFLSQSVSYFQELSKNLNKSVELLPILSGVQLVPSLMFNIANALSVKNIISNSYFQKQLYEAFFLWPNSPEINYLLSELKKIENKQSLGLYFAKRATSYGSVSNFFYHHYAVNLAESGNVHKAIETLYMIKDINQRPPLLWRLAKLKHQIGDVEGARIAIGSALELQPDNAVFMYLKFQILQNVEPDKAAEIAKSILLLSNTPEWIRKKLENHRDTNRYIAGSGLSFCTFPFLN